MRVFGTATKKGIASLFLLLGTVAAFGQPTLLPPPDFIKIADQSDAPVILSLPDRQDLGSYFNPVTYTLLNKSQKAIRSVVITGFPKEPHHSVGIGALQPGATRTLMHGDLNARRRDEVFSLSVDYVLFTDGTHWGEDKTGESAFLFGYIEGATKFYKEIKQHLDDSDGVKNFLTRPHKVLQTERRGRRDEGIAMGYSYWLNTVKFEFQNSGDPSGIASKVSDLGIDLGMERPISKGIRRINRTTYKNEPIKIVEMKEGDRDVSFGKDYESVDWLKDLSVTIKNNSGKTITYLSLRLDFVETANSGNPMMFPLSYGSPAGFTQVARFADTPVLTGGMLRLVLDEKRYESLKRFIAERQSLDNLSRLNMSIEMIQFDDRTAWNMGSLMRQDPENPRRWIPVDK